MLSGTCSSFQFLSIPFNSTPDYLLSIFHKNLFPMIPRLLRSCRVRKNSMPPIVRRSPLIATWAHHSHTMPKRPKCMDKDRYEKDAFKIQMEIDEQKVRNGSVGCEQTLHIAGWANPGRGYLPGPQWGFVIYRTCYDEFVTTHSGEVMRWDDIRTEIESIATYQLGKDVARGSDPHKRLEALRFLWVEDKDKFNEMSVDQVQKYVYDYLINIINKISLSCYSKFKFFSNC